MSEMLSQQEVDALLQAVSSDLGPQAESVETAARAAAAALGAALGALLEVPVEAHYQDAGPADAAGLAARLGGAAAWVETAAGGQVVGAFGLLVRAADALALAGTLLGPDAGLGEQLDGAALEPLGEAFSQAVGRIAAAWTETAGGEVSAAPPRTLAVDLAAGPAGGPPPALTAEGIWVADLEVALGDAAAVPVHLVFSAELAEAWRELLAPPDASGAGGDAGASGSGDVRPPGNPPDPPSAGTPGPEGIAVQDVRFGELRSGPGGAQPNLDLILDVPLNLTVELGRTRRAIREILALGSGSVLELDKLAGEAVDIVVNGRLIAKGEVVVINENFGVRITEIGTPAERVEKLR